MAASILVLGAALAAAQMSAQPQPVERFRDVKEWAGSVTISKTGSGSAVNADLKSEFSLDESLSLTFTLRKDPKSTKDRPRWVGTVEGGSAASIQETWKLTMVKGGVVIQSADCNGNQLQGRDVALTLNLRDKTYDLVFPDDVNYLCRGTANGHALAEASATTSLMPLPKISAADAASAYTPEGQERLMGYIGSRPRKLPDSGTTLSGAKTFEALPNKHTTLATWASIPATVTWSIEGDAKPLELVVDPEGYEQWRPLPGPDEATPGEHKLPVKATLQLRGGGEPPVKVKTFRFALAEVSKEPGIAMNYPLVPGAPRPDLRFEAADGFTITDEGKVAVKTGTPTTTATATLAAYDGGGWGTLAVTAILEDERQVTGHLREQPGLERILLPKRDPWSKISDRWKVNTRVRGADGDDREVLPLGDGHSGDGLTMYEEYRGFIENGEWVGGDPLRKDFFIRDEMEGTSKQGIDAFERATGLTVHHRLRATELRDDRVINANRAEGPHVVDQHGIILRVGTVAGASVAVSADGNPGTPGHIQELRVTTVASSHARGGIADPLNDELGGINERGRVVGSIAHEMLHACNVFHHGESDRKKLTWIVTLDANGIPTVTEDGVRVTIRMESDGRLWIPRGMTPGQTRTYAEEVTVGMNGGEHSGAQDCMMRYDTSWAYVSETDPTVRWRVQEQVNFDLCDSKKGAGVNAPDRSPRSRYGDATVGRCKSQICVNDIFMRAHTPP